jgi:hypothetical protein
MSKGKKPKGLGLDLNAQMKKLQDQLVQTQEALKHETVEASAGGGAVTVVMSGTQECQTVQIPGGESSHPGFTSYGGTQIGTSCWWLGPIWIIDEEFHTTPC